MSAITTSQPGFVATRNQGAATAHRFHHLLALQDFDAEAKRRLPRMLYGFISGAAERNASLADNAAAFADYFFVPRVLADVSRRSQRTTLFGKEYSAPFGIAPTGAAAICAYRSDIVEGKAAVAANIPMILSATSLIPLEDVRRESGIGWYQAYLPGENARIEPTVDRVLAAGYDTFVLTADVPVSANRENNVRNGFSIPIKPSVRLVWEGVTHPRWLLGTFARTLIKHGLPHVENMDAVRGPPIISRNLERATGNRDQLSWDHVRLIRKRWPGKLVIKGLLSPEDARTARDCGADGIIVSNHGGRQLDATIAPLRMLPRVVEAVPGMTVMLDGGIRRGTDVIKALALGAKFVFLGRPFLFAAAVGGEDGVGFAIDILKTEILRDMALLGITSLTDLDPALVERVR
jgi:L-lactate dehydrogenase (cytochrome)